MDEPYVPPGSVVRSVASESVLLLGARTALLMQLAHPLVAQGVADHSGFEGDRVGRLLRTVRASITMVFGSRQQADTVIQRIRHTHERVRGRLDVASGKWPVGHPYRADDPELLLWVHATLVDTAVRFYDLLVRPSGPKEKDEYVRDLGPIASAVGVTDPPTRWSEVRSYIAKMIEDGSVEVGDLARKLARPILYPGIPLVPDRLFRPLASVTRTMLPPEIGEGYGLTPAWMDRAVVAAMSSSLRRIRPLVPGGVRSLGVGVRS